MQQTDSSVVNATAMAHAIASKDVPEFTRLVTLLVVNSRETRRLLTDVIVRPMPIEHSLRLAALSGFVRLHASSDDDMKELCSVQHASSFLPRLVASDDTRWTFTAALIGLVADKYQLELIVKAVLLHGHAVPDDRTWEALSWQSHFAPSSASEFLCILGIASTSPAVVIAAEEGEGTSRFHVVVAVAQLWGLCGRPALECLMGRRRDSKSTSTLVWWHSLVASRTAEEMSAEGLKAEAPATTAFRQLIHYFHTRDTLREGNLLEAMNMEMLQALFTIAEQRGDKLLTSKTYKYAKGCFGVAVAQSIALAARKTPPARLDYLFSAKEATGPGFLEELQALVDKQLFCSLYKADLSPILVPYLLEVKAKADAEATATAMAPAQKKPLPKLKVKLLPKAEAGAEGRLSTKRLRE